MAGHIRFHRHNLNTIFAAFLCHFVQRLFSAGTQNQIRTLLRKKNRCCICQYLNYRQSQSLSYSLISSSLYSPLSYSICYPVLSHLSSVKRQVFHLYICMPPHTGMAIPVICPAISEHKNTTASATSCVVPIFFMGII